MVTTISGQLIAQKLKFGIVVSRFNDFITNRLLDGCVDALVRHGAKDSDITVAWTPGCFEVPLMAQKLAQSKKFDAVICLGAVIRGATPHFDYVASKVSKGIAQINLAANVPVIFGIITADTIEQSIERAGTKEGNKGASAALSAIEMANALKNL